MSDSLSLIFQYFLKYDTISNGIALSYAFNLPIFEARLLMDDLAEKGIVEKLSRLDTYIIIWRLKAPRSHLEKLLLLS